MQLEQAGRKMYMEKKNPVMDTNDLATYIEDEGVAAEIVYVEVETSTVEAAASAVGVRPEQIGKSILFLAHGRPILVIANGTTRVSYKRLAKYLGLNRKKLKLAKAPEVLNVTGYTVGTVPPFGHRRPLQTVLETEVLNQNELFAGGGAINALVRVSSAELLRVTRAETASLQDK